MSRGGPFEIGCWQARRGGFDPRNRARHMADALWQASGDGAGCRVGVLSPGIAAVGKSGRGGDEESAETSNSTLDYDSPPLPISLSPPLLIAPTFPWIPIVPRTEDSKGSFQRNAGEELFSCF